MILLKEKHRISASPLMTVVQYLQELQEMISHLSGLIDASLDAATGSAASASESTRASWIRELGELQGCFERHAHVNPEKLIADWEVYSECVDKVEVSDCS
jgi:hypothetical protein